MYAAVFPHYTAMHASAVLPAIEVPAAADSRLGDFSNRVCHAMKISTQLKRILTRRDGYLNGAENVLI